MTTEIHGLLLIGTEGFVIASTLSHTPATSRVAAVSSALVGLAKQAAYEWERGDFQEVRVRYKDSEQRNWDVQLLAVTDTCALVIVMERPAVLSVANIVLSFNTQQAAHYVARVLNGDNDPLSITWM